MHESDALASRHQSSQSGIRAGAHMQLSGAFLCCDWYVSVQTLLMVRDTLVQDELRRAMRAPTCSPNDVNFTLVGAYFYDLLGPGPRPKDGDVESLDGGVGSHSLASGPGITNQ
ncbi:hypothetical protein MJO28_016433 [Puccinia striiformis f. sp. tritici]|uniref:Uncharacterized protein n=1 Tax=Puccinia striiformis f. sp. tritici TaxID=168172 RepID=A0ACC0DN77_9BASI|nr:hypothetical protein MJO28_016433 [Puccinia striiformis f. sp. tritici]